MFADRAKIVIKAGDGGEIPPRLLNVLKQHFEAILDEFPNTIKIIISEV